MMEMQRYFRVARHFVLSFSAVILLLQLSPIEAQTVTPLASQFHLSVTGPEEIVFNWQKDHCPKQDANDNDVPDSPAHAIRDAQGLVHLYGSNHNNRQMVGDSLNDVKRVSCASVMPSEYNSDPAAYADYEWLNSVYTLDGKTVTGVVHEEFHGWTVPGDCSIANDAFATCWVASTIAALSTDGGNTFQRQPGLARLIATIPYPYVKDIGHPELANPGNIIYSAQDKHYYLMIAADPYKDQQAGACLLRNDSLDPKGWKAWDGTDFTISFASPYYQTDLVPTQHVCTPVSPNEIRMMDNSLTYNSVTQSYIVMSSSVDNDATGKVVAGIYYAFSTDLIHWSHRQLLLAGPRPAVGNFPNNPAIWQSGDPDPILYASFLDPNSTSRNFDTTGVTGYVYYTHFHLTNGKTGEDRDLVRVPVKVTQ